MDTRRFKRELGSREQMFRGGRDQHLARRRNARDSRRFMHRETAYVVAHELHLAGMNPGPNRDTKMGDRSTNRPRASNRARRTVEHRQESVASRLNLAPSKTVKLLPHLAVMLEQQLAPRGIAQPPEMRGRIHDIGA